MVKFAPFDARGSVSTGSEFMRPAAPEDDTGKSLQRLGGEMAQAANAFVIDQRRLAERADQMDRRNQALSQENVLIRLQNDERARLAEETQNLAPGAAGFHQRYMEGLDARWRMVLDNMPDDLRPEMENRFLRAREAIGLQSLNIEVRERQRYLQDTVNARRQLITDGITNGVTSLDAARADIDAFVGGLQLPGNAHAALTRELHTAAEMATLQRMIQANPQAVASSLQAQVPGNLRSPNPVVNHVMDAARRNGVPVDIMMAIVQGESAFNPNSRGQGSSAYGLGQLIDSNWRELGIQRSDDPAIQAEATARLLARRMSYLQSNGLDVNAASLWGSHFLGPAGYRAVATADPNTPIRDVLLPLLGARNYTAATSNNGNLLRDGMTAGQVLTQIQGYMTQASARVQARADRPVAVDGSAPDAPLNVAGVQFNYLTSQQSPQLIGPAEQAVQRLNAVRAQGRERMDGRIFLDTGADFDPFNAQHTRSVDAVYQNDGVQQALIQGDQAAFGRVIADSLRLNHIPASAVHALRQITASGGASDPNTIRAYQTTAEIFAQSNVAASSSHIPAELRNRITQYQVLTADMGMSPADAITRIQQMESPEFRQQRDANGQRARTWARQLTDTDVQYTFQSWMRQPRAVTQGEASQMLGLFRQSFTFHATQSGDRDMALRMAREDMSRVFNWSQIFGRNDLVAYPPERTLPPVNGSHQWVVDQAVDIARLQTGDRTLDRNRVMMVADRITAGDVQAGRPPRYRIVVRGSNGIPTDVGSYEFNAHGANLASRLMFLGGGNAPPPVNSIQPLGAPTP